MRFGRPIIGLPIPAAVLALLAAMLFSPGKAQAECGDYLMGGGHAAKMAHDTPTKPSVPCPCKGPQCSQQPIAPFVPPAPAPTVNPAEWFTLTTVLNATGDQTCGRV